MNARIYIAIVSSTIVLCSLIAAGCAGKTSASGFEFIDEYLASWDRFAQGANELAPRLEHDKPRFHQELAAVLRLGDKRAPSRLVFYAVVQVGGFISRESQLGRECSKLFGQEVALFTADSGEQSYFSGDIYFWWVRHRTEFEPFPLYDEWSRREFARKVVIPMYESQRGKLMK